jgi:hypothetical protein
VDVLHDYRDVHKKSPFPITLRPGQKVISLFSGGDTVFVIARNDETTELLTWGVNLNCTNAIKADIICLPHFVQLLPDVQKGFSTFSSASISSDHALFISDQARLFVCGMNSHGQLGLGDTHSVDKITGVKIPNTGFKFNSVSASKYRSMGVLEFTCFNDCNGQGTCMSQNFCDCHSGYTGPECQYEVCFGVPSNKEQACM